MNTTIHVTVDRQTKTEAAKLARELGLDLSTVVKAGLKQFVATKTFLVEKSRRMTPYLERVVERARQDFAAGRNISGPFVTARDVARHLNKFIKKSKNK
ncbi:MAG: Uncharacterized protein G01um101430_371 [Parcubacteria group bacterium Gr01-1014_30]|nr:MAG: Uncharacterized protein G01um101430_371 [Parcubacteria group bacterium Gr01-1014_30]